MVVRQAWTVAVSIEGTAKEVVATVQQARGPQPKPEARDPNPNPKPDPSPSPKPNAEPEVFPVAADGFMCGWGDVHGGSGMDILIFGAKHGLWDYGVGWLMSEGK